jgi:hypothetical protein
VSIARHCKFCVELPVALWHWLRERYYASALNHCGNAHPDSWLLTRRMIQSRLRVNDFIRKYTD